MISNSPRNLAKLSGTLPAFTLLELLAVVAIISILALLAVPQVSAMKKRAAVAQCLNNMRQIGLAIESYANENNGGYPVGKNENTGTLWTSLVGPYIGGNSGWNPQTGSLPHPVFLDPTRKFEKAYVDKSYTWGFGINIIILSPESALWSDGVSYSSKINELVRRVSVSNPSQRMLLGQSPEWYLWKEKDIVDSRIGNGRTAVLFFDGHAEAGMTKAEALQAMLNP